jgi:hypothetical protein
VRTEGILGTGFLGGLYKGLQLTGAEEKRLGTTGGGDEVTLRDFGLGSCGSQIGQEASRHTQTLSGTAVTSLGG